MEPKRSPSDYVEPPLAKVPRGSMDGRCVDMLVQTGYTAGRSSTVRRNLLSRMDTGANGPVQAQRWLKASFVACPCGRLQTIPCQRITCMQILCWVRVMYARTCGGDVTACGDTSSLFSAGLLWLRRVCVVEIAGSSQQRVALGTVRMNFRIGAVTRTAADCPAPGDQAYRPLTHPAEALHMWPHPGTAEAVADDRTCVELCELEPLVHAAVQPAEPRRDQWT
jgi:hypothetical protein